METALILLHTCCAPCATASIERLIESTRVPILFFSNSNISPRKEYEKRLGEVQRLAEIVGIDVYVDEYDHGKWLEWISRVPGYENEPEGGARCGACFHYSFTRTADKASSLGIQDFTTALSVSPYKKYDLLTAAGSLFEGFIPFNLKKQNGYKRSIELSRLYGLYRQNYCGCEFSRKT